MLEPALLQQPRRRLRAGTHLLGSKPSNDTLGIRTSSFKSFRYSVFWPRKC